jgi:polyisoprenyl-phosphate glycosyltransferase
MMSNKKLISIVTPCFNEEENVADAYNAIKSIRDTNKNYDWEHLFIDNNSSDNTVEILKSFCLKDKSLKVIVNTNNFGHIRSHVYAYLLVKGDAVIPFLCDLQDPADTICLFIEKWEQGNSVVVGIKETSDENIFLFFLRKYYYIIMDKISDVRLIKNYHGFGLYDQSFMEIIREINDPYPYFRGLVSEYSGNPCAIYYHQKSRTKGKSKNNFITLLDTVIQGAVAYSSIPLRIITMFGVLLSVGSFLTAFCYFLYKIFYWESFEVGVAPLVIGFFVFSSVQLMFIGIIGEYLAATIKKIDKHPLVIEKYRINF